MMLFSPQRFRWKISSWSVCLLVPLVKTLVDRVVLFINQSFCAPQFSLDLVITVGHLAGLDVVVLK